MTPAEVVGQLERFAEDHRIGLPRALSLYAVHQFLIVPGLGGRETRRPPCFDLRTLALLAAKSGGKGHVKCLGRRRTNQSGRKVVVTRSTQGVGLIQLLGSTRIVYSSGGNKPGALWLHDSETRLNRWRQVSYAAGARTEEWLWNQKNRRVWALLRLAISRQNQHFRRTGRHSTNLVELGWSSGEEAALARMGYRLSVEVSKTNHPDRTIAYPISAGGSAIVILGGGGVPLIHPLPLPLGHDRSGYRGKPLELEFPPGVDGAGD